VFNANFSNILAILFWSNWAWSKWYYWYSRLCFLP